MRGFLLAAGVLLGTRQASGQEYPGCIEDKTVLRHAGAHAIFVDLSAFGTAGCWQNDCKNSDKFNAADQGICARACASIEQCTHWTFGEQEGATKCFVRKSDAGREAADGWAAAPKACTPPEIPHAQLALATVDLPSLQACDAGKSDECPDMAKAVSTWKYAIGALQRATEGNLDANTAQYVTQIASDTDAFAAQMSEDNFPIVIGNNRQVFNALRGWLDSQPKSAFDSNDASLPNPMRGKLCGTSSCFEL